MGLSKALLHQRLLPGNAPRTRHCSILPCMRASQRCNPCSTPHSCVHLKIGPAVRSETGPHRLWQQAVGCVVVRAHNRVISTRQCVLRACTTHRATAPAAGRGFAGGARSVARAAVRNVINKFLHAVGGFTNVRSCCATMAGPATPQPQFARRPSHLAFATAAPRVIQANFVTGVPACPEKSSLGRVSMFGSGGSCRCRHCLFTLHTGSHACPQS